MSQFPEQELTFICLSNCDDITAWTMNARIVDLMLGDTFPQPPAKPGIAASDLPSVEVPEAELRETVGGLPDEEHESHLADCLPGWRRSR